jgi:hypothetical protein
MWGMDAVRAIYGIDFSEAEDAVDKTWIAQGVFDDESPFFARMLRN